VHFRQARQDEGGAILALRARCLADADPEKNDPRFREWQFAQGASFVGDEGGELLSHVGLIGLPHRKDGSILPGALAVDAMTAPEARGRGAYTGVMRAALAETNASVVTAYQIRKSVLGAMISTGFHTAARVPVLVRPAALRARAAAALALTREDTAWMSEVASAGARDGCVARTPEFLAWRFFDNPVWRYEVTGVKNSAYIVTRRTTLRGLRTLAVVDLAWRDPKIARALLRDAVGTARHYRCAVVAALVSPRHPAFGMFLRRGFLPGPHWFRLLVYPQELATGRWSVMWADTDHL
jgi:GNAT superfamily N-acetyltransferase